MIKKKFLVFTIVLIFVLGTVFGAQSDYWVDNMKIDIKVGKDAVFDVNETYSFYFATPHHGFYRDIPVDYSTGKGPSRKVKLRSLDCSDYFSLEEENGYVSMKIGSADKSYTGEKLYNISYLYDVGADRNEGYDEFYYNIVGSYWECPIDKVTFSVVIPCTLEETDNYIFLTKGSYGSYEQIPFDVSETPDGLLITGSTSEFWPGEALTLRVQLPDNWYTDARKPFDARETWKALAPVLSLICVAVCLTIWALGGRDTVPIITAKFEAPEGFSPLVEGFLADGTVDDKDITSMIYYWADKGLLTISEEKKNRFVFTKTGDISFTAPDFERKLFYSFFGDGDVVTINSLQNSNFYFAMVNCKADVAKFFTKERKLKKQSSNALATLSFIISFLPIIFFAFSKFLFEGGEEGIGGLFVADFVYVNLLLVNFKVLFKKWYLRKSNFFPTVLCLFPVFVAFIIANFTDSIVLYSISVLSSALCVFLSSITDKRSEYGTKVLEGTLGYREFIEKVQISELVTMIDKDPMLYYHVLSYAIVFGLEDKWAKKFASVAVPPPVWYTGSRMFDYMYFTHMSSRMNMMVRNSVAKSHVSKISRPGQTFGGSFFGSSGFAGGGFGGGGGRAW